MRPYSGPRRRGRALSTILERREGFPLATKVKQRAGIKVPADMVALRRNVKKAVTVSHRVRTLREQSANGRRSAAPTAKCTFPEPSTSLRVEASPALSRQLQNQALGGRQ